VLGDAARRTAIVCATKQRKSPRPLLALRISGSREHSDRRNVNTWIGHVNAQIAGT
jgi:hypothetical protein